MTDISLQKWCEDHHMNIKFHSEFVCEIADEKYFLIPMDMKILDKKGRLTVTDSDVREFDCEKAIFFFGNAYFWCTPPEFKLNPLLYLGKADMEMETNSFLGVHGQYDLMNSVGGYKNFVAKAKMFGCKSVGICDKNTMAGHMKFMNACKDAEIKPIFGATYTINKGEKKYDIKVYVKDEIGYNNMLQINWQRSKEGISESQFIKMLEGLVLVIDPIELPYRDTLPLTLNTEDIYYQLNGDEYISAADDNLYLDRLTEYKMGDIEPISITDAYFVNKEDAEIRKLLNAIRDDYDRLSESKYLKCKDEYISDLITLYHDSDESMYSDIQKAIENEDKVASMCNFEIRTGERHLPEYPMTNEEVEKYGTKDNMFLSLIDENLDKVADRLDEALERVETEYKVITDAHVDDYFLIVRDIMVNGANNRGIFTGIGRGSAAGSLISYLLGIVGVNPLDYGLLFERFLNKGRLGESKTVETITVTGDDGNTKTLYTDDTIILKRNGKKMVVKCSEIKEGDEL